jgi:N-dimethylarginine dimethylaminohydrolase
MCPPTFFEVDYSINPWMDPSKPVDSALARMQWEGLCDLYRSLGHTVVTIAPEPDLPDMVFVANSATVVSDQVLLARFRHAERSGETQAYQKWFKAVGYSRIRQATIWNEGEGDLLLAGPRILAGTGFRTDRAAHTEAQEFFGTPVTSLTLVDPRFYHLDTALAVLSDEEIMYYPPAFDLASQALLRELYPTAILADTDDAMVFGLNAVSDGRHVILPQAATHLIAELRAHEYVPIGVDVSEFLKAGGGVKCCTLALRNRTVPGGEL